MRARIYAVFLVIFLLITFPVFSQETDGEAGQGGGQDFFLLPVLETVFSGNLRWSPDWPDIPPDGFSLPGGNPPPAALVLSNEKDTFTLKRDVEGRLLEFPFFYNDGYAIINLKYSEAGQYSVSGALQTMNITFKKFQMQDEASSNDESQNGESLNDEKTFNIIFLHDFLPYSELSPGGSFPVIFASTTKLDSSGDSGFYVFLFESPLFLTETWYDLSGNMLAFCKASVDVENGSWRIRSLQSYGENGASIEDRFFDSFGNITEIRFFSGGSENRRALALYRDSMPVYWRRDNYICDLQWDAAGVLTVIKAWDETGSFDTEYRYEYGMDALGVWLWRGEAAYKVQYNLLTPQPSYSRGRWTRSYEPQPDTGQWADEGSTLDIFTNRR